MEDLVLKSTVTKMKKKKKNLTRRAQLLIWNGRNKDKKFEDTSKKLIDTEKYWTPLNAPL